MSMEQIQANVLLEKRLCEGAPFYVLGPLVTDCAPGHDHITAAIGGALAAWAGADFLCYVTPAEHLGLPGIEDVRQGVIASKIAGHAADLARAGARPEFSRCRWHWTGPQTARDRPLDRRGLPGRRRAAAGMSPVRTITDQGMRCPRHQPQQKDKKENDKSPGGVAELTP
jgi:hypothetical protein